MGNFTYILALFLIIAWAIGFFALSSGGLIHILLVLGLISLFVRIFQGTRAL